MFLTTNFKKSFVYVRFPKNGLGNLLIIWAKAKVFGYINNIPVYTSKWSSLRFGPFLRNEYKKRLYTGYFIEPNPTVNLQISLLYLFYKKKIVNDISVIDLYKSHKTLYELNKSIIKDDLFSSLRDYRTFVIGEFYKIITPALLQKINQYPIPQVGVHIRRGDFIISDQSTPDHYFINVLKVIRQIISYDIHVTVFTDAREYEIKDVLKLGNISISDDKPDILDMLLLSKSRILVLSRSSTFGYWASFISEGIIIRPPNDWQGKLRDKNDQRELIFDINNIDDFSTKLLMAL